MDKFKILHVDPEREWGGGEGQVLELTTYLHRSGHRSVVAADSRGMLHHRLVTAGLPVYSLTVHNHLDWRAGLRLRHLVRTGAYDLAHFHTARAHALSPWLYGLQMKRVVTRRMDYPVTNGCTTRFLYIHNVDAVVAISAGVRAALLAGGVPVSRIRLIPSGIDMARFVPAPASRVQIRSSYGLGANETVVLSVGALVERKGHRTLLQAAYRLHQQGLRIHYLVCGEGALRASLEAEARALGLGTRVHFVGFCSDMPAYLASADVFVHVPLWEGLGIAVIEAMAAGMPVIASRVGGIPELIDDHTTGLIVPPQDPPALAAALSHLIHDPHWAHMLGQAGQTWVRNHFDVTTMAQANEALYYELLEDFKQR